MYKIFQKSLFKTIVLVLFLLTITSNALAQTSSGSLSFNPSSVTITENGTATLDVVYTGVEITAAKIKIDVGPGLQITDFAENDELMVIINDPDNGEIHLGKLTEGNIASGTTLLTMTIQATGCGEGDITFDQEEVLIPDVTLSFTDATYTIDCDGTDPTTPPNGTTGPTPTTLPKTGILDENFGKILMASFIVSAGIALGYYAKISKQTDINSTNLDLIIEYS
ncbi:hypothetical protein GF362_05020 [Candidatus Dojkabacteria bacterium]|nr:hypothetical protein [Candidatus Dojkabacteria bacterium]